MNKITTKIAQNASANVVTAVGINLTKKVFAIHSVNAAGKSVLLKLGLRREHLLDLLAQHSCAFGRS